MEQQEAIDSLHERLAAIQRSLKAPKGQRNDFGKYSYRSCEDILEAVKPLLDGLVLTISDEVVEVGGRVYIKATVSLKNSLVSIEIAAFAREPLQRKGMDESQITGAASSYARKYALNGLFLIDDTKDADTMDNSLPEVIEHTEEQKILIDKLMADNNAFGFHAYVQTIPEGLHISLYSSLKGKGVTARQKLWADLKTNGGLKWDAFLVNINLFILNGDRYSIESEMLGFENYEKIHLAAMLGKEKTQQLKKLLEK